MPNPVINCTHKNGHHYLRERGDVPEKRTDGGEQNPKKWTVPFLRYHGRMYPVKVRKGGYK